MEGIALAVGHGGVVVRLRGVVRQGWIRTRCGRWVPLDEPETKRIVRNRRKSGRNHERKLTITAFDARRRGFLPPRRWRGACCHYPPSVFWVRW
jgi:hypothetical protein